MSTRVVLLFNPASGRGKAERFACALTEALSADGWDIDSRIVGQPGSEAGFDGARAIVVIGGDGTTHRAAPLIARAKVPMVIAPMGTENLLAKELGHRAQVAALCHAVRHGEASHIDLPSVNGVSFLVMCSVGLDAAIVAEVDARRTGTIRKSTYLKPALRQALRPTLPALQITIDGEIVCNGLRGMLVIANCKRYGAKMNPATNASMTDGLLDVAFYPMRHALDAIRWAALSRLGRHENARGFIKARGRFIEIENAGGSSAPVQVDGEPAPNGVSLPLRFIANNARVAILRF